MKVFAYEKMDGVDMIDTFKASWSKLYIKEEGKYLIKYENYQYTSFDVLGFRIVKDVHDWNNEVDKLYKEYNYSHRFGLYEEIEYDPEEFCNTIKIVKISDEQYDTILKLFGESYGLFPI
jgi:hypothetical protein